MKRLLCIMGLLAIFGTADAQSRKKAPEGYEYVDSVIYIRTAAADSSLVGRSIFSLMPSKSNGGKGDVVINQSPEIEEAMAGFVRTNQSRPIKGYRVRIYFDNKQNARGASGGIYSQFSSTYPDIPAYRSYTNPYFKVTVGDFRTKSEAMRFLEEIKGQFPQAFVVKENIKFPVVDKDHAYVTDTVKVLRKIVTETAVTE